MPGKIFVEYYEITQNDPVTHQLGKDHMLLAYQDENGQEYIIRGGQADEFGLGTLDHAIFDDSGPILVDAGIPAEFSRDYMNRIAYDTPSTAYQLTDEDLDGRDPADVWDTMVDSAQLIASQNIPYHLGSQNSNSVAGTVLSSAGIDPMQVLPDGKISDNFPGLGNTLSGDFFDPTEIDPFDAALLGF